MTRRYQRLLAAAMCAVMTAMPFTAFAANQAPETDLTELMAEVIRSAEPSLEASVQTDRLESLLQPGVSSGDPIRVTPPADQIQEDAAPEETVPEVTVPEEEPAAEAPVRDPDAVAVVFNGQPLAMALSARLLNDVTYVPVRAFFEAMGCTVAWDAASGSIRITRGAELTMELQPDSRLAKANGRCWYMAQACITVDGVSMMPVRDAAKVFSAQVAWDAAAQTVSLTGGTVLESGDTYYDQEDLLWIARIVWCESGNQPLEGKVGVANVILNRMRSAGFPGTAEGVIFDRRYGVQFSPTVSGTIYNDPTEECWLAAKLALEGYETAPGCLYFVNAKAASRSWAGKNRPFYGNIGDHAFFL